MTDNRTPPLFDAIKNLIDARLAEIHTSFPAVVVAYDSALERADVQPLIRRTYTFVDGSKQLVDLPQLLGASVQWPRFGGWVIRGELSPRDIVEVRVAERSLEQWLASQDLTATVDPKDTRKFDLSDAIVFPGMVLSPTAGLADLTIGREDGTSLIRLTALGEIHLAAGGEADQHLLRGEDVKTWLDNHTHPTSFGPSGRPTVPLPASALSSGGKIR